VWTNNWVADSLALVMQAADGSGAEGITGRCLLAFAAIMNQVRHRQHSICSFYPTKAHACV